ncbi:MAG: T9SS type A sorting domain-containing protein, partial [Saprospiraceae bacterium]
EGYCSAQRNFEILEDPACQVKIRGKIQYDPQNADCVADPLAFDFGGMLIHLLPDDIFTTTDANGYYEFIRPPGNYTVKFVDNLHFDVYCPANNSHTVSLPNFGSVAENNDFFINKKFAPNLGISVTPGLALRGSTLQSKITICNFSSEYAADASLVFKHDPLLTNPGPAGFFQSYDPQSYTAVSNIDYVLTYPTCKTYNFDMQVPANAPLGELLHFSMDILPLAGDIFPGDNHVEWTQTVVGSYDPNDKQVSPGENEWGGSIYEKDSVLRYTIRFQNTGSHPATTVEIRDTLDEDLDVGSIITGATSHPFKMLFEGKNGLIFRFENINLPDSLFSQAASQGFVTFTIQRKPNLPIGTVIPNRAGIYFDFNAPVPTNWVESVLRPPAGTGPEPLRQFNIALFPNPNTGCFKIELPAAAPPGMSLRIIDLAGRLVVEKQTEIGSAYQVVNAESLLPGLYFLEVLSKGRILAMKKFVKQ